MQSLVGSSIVDQCRDYTCWHCCALSGVRITHDDAASQEWFCSTCRGLMLVSKLEGSKIRIELGRHGPNHLGNLAQPPGCCRAVPDVTPTVIIKPTKVKKSLVPVVHERLGENIFNEQLLKPGEELAARFFDQNKLTFEKGFSVDTKLIDFCIRTVNGDILWDNADLEECELDRAALKAGIQGILRFEHLFKRNYINQLKQKLHSLSGVAASAGGAWNPHARIAAIVRSKSKQFKPAKGKYPCVLALYNAGSIPADSDLFLRQGIEGDKYFRPDRYSAISAISVLEETRGQITLRLYHNRYAAVPLWRGAFPVGTTEFDVDNLWDSETKKLGE
jgi:hypothetical protein